ncbi:hypothetical protein GP486_002640 [Trichoglossum hirsutum]|uniref:Peptidase A1 domain-containing protein n=1 Tax=Trichoglossum hirsutum TaxID=265104 RepID=A0A9P8RRI3_9PEZI|nr:hypothetical protein GP486_002640 [Trichoglossum hirsutum]
MRKKAVAMSTVMDFSLRLVLLASVVRCAIEGVVSVPPSQYWDGDNGPWSTFAIEAGTPPQNLRVLASTSSSSTWVVVPDGCIPSDPSDCPSLRGFTFQTNSSRSWTDAGLFQLPLHSLTLLGYSGNAKFGLDNLTLGWQGQGGPELNHQVVGGIATKDFFVGSLGINARAVNFTDFNYPNASLLGTLRAENKIKGTSFGYTAGAPYKPTKIYGSLTFGGYDASRFTPNNMTFSFGYDTSRDLLIGIRDISTNTTANSSKTTPPPPPLLPSPINAFIDTTVPDIWLPVSACQQFEQTLGLVWDVATELYLVNDSLHNALLARDEQFRFRFGMGLDGGETIDLVVPYKAFDLDVTLPETQNKTRYFPIRRAANDSMYTIGRVLLQESYLFVDYDRSTFTLSQALFPNANVPPKLTAIHAPTSSDSESGHLSRGAIAGITVSAISATISLVIITTLLLHRRRKQKTVEVPGDKTEELDGSSGGRAVGDSYEVAADQERELEAGGEDGLRRLRELEAESRAVYEMPGSEVQVQELGGRMMVEEKAKK